MKIDLRGRQEGTRGNPTAAPPRSFRPARQGASRVASARCAAAALPGQTAERPSLRRSALACCAGGRSPRGLYADAPWPLLAPWPVSLRCSSRPAARVAVRRAACTLARRGRSWLLGLSLCAACLVQLLRPGGGRALRSCALPCAARSPGRVVREGRSSARRLAPFPPPRRRGAPPLSPSGARAPPCGNFSGGQGVRSRAPLPLVAVVARGARALPRRLLCGRLRLRLRGLRPLLASRAPPLRRSPGPVGCACGASS